jgi:hypothetical protein
MPTAKIANKSSSLSMWIMMHRSFSGVINGSNFPNLDFFAGVCIENYQIPVTLGQQKKKKCGVFHSSMVRINKWLKYEPEYLSIATG